MSSFIFSLETNSEGGQKTSPRSRWLSFFGFEPYPKHFPAKIILVAVLYYVAAKFGDFLMFIDIFNHEEYPPYFPPAGVALGLLLILGRAVWPGIVLATLLLMPKDYWFVQYDPGLPDIIIVTLAFVIGRAIEVIVAFTLVRRWCPDGEPFKTTKGATYFILVALLISWIGASISTAAIQFMLSEDIATFLTRMIGWYIDNVVGVLMFTPLVVSLVDLRNASAQQKKYSAVLLLTISVAGLLLYYLLHARYNLFQVVHVNSLPFLIIPILLWLAFHYHQSVSTFAVILVSIAAIYITTLGMGPFVMPDSWDDSVWLLQSFLIVAAISTLVLSAAANERSANMLRLKAQADALKETNKTLIRMMEDLSVARSKAEESDRLKSAFLANMSHEVRTPMNAIMGLAELLNRPDLTEERRMQFSQLIRERSSNLLAIFNDVLTIAQLETRKKECHWVDANIREVFEQLIQVFELQNSKGLKISYRIALPSGQERIQADLEHLKQVLSNLISNAIKFTPHGSIELGCSLSDSGKYLFSVADTGVGIARKDFELIFKPFSQVNEFIHIEHGGTGLGLAICKELVTLWGGEIWVESEEGKGSTFFFTMPVPQVI